MELTFLARLSSQTMGRAKQHEPKNLEFAQGNEDVAFLWQGFYLFETDPSNPAAIEPIAKKAQAAVAARPELVAKWDKLYGRPKYQAGIVRFCKQWKGHVKEGHGKCLEWRRVE